ncbi:MAG: hypothetical protein J5656_05670 [Clostridia bacterium]|nr:hypothetical protein [Clostridia bacterium]
MKCKYCGSDISPMDHYCPECGHINESYLSNDTYEDRQTSDDPFEDVVERRSCSSGFYTVPTDEEIQQATSSSRPNPVFAILSLIFGILGALIPALILGIIGLKKYSKDDPSCSKFRKMCIAGIILGIIVFIIEIIVDVLYFLYFGSLLLIDSSGSESFSFIPFIQL